VDLPQHGPFPDAIREALERQHGDPLEKVEQSVLPRQSLTCESSK